MLMLILKRLSFEAIDPVMRKPSKNGSVNARLLLHVRSNSSKDCKSAEGRERTRDRYEAE
jgi:hypothetical protein